VIERASPPDLGSSDPLCPVCLAPIKPDDKVRGLGNDLMHEKCDYTRPAPRQPNTAPCPSP
jgi:hypothetical protein